MPSTKELVFDRTKFDKYIKGDLGIGDLIHKQETLPIINQAKTPQDKAVLAPLIVPNKKTGLWALEKSFINTAFDLNRPLIEMNKHLLELFGHLEYIMTCISGGPNPFNLPSSYANAFKQNISDMRKFKTQFEPESLNTAGQTELPPPTLPAVVFLGRFNSIGDSIGPDGQDTDRFSIDSSNKVWPQYQSFEEFRDEQTNLIFEETAEVDEPYKSDIRDSRSDSFDDEWDDMSNKNQLRKNHNFLPTGIKKYYRPLKVEYQNQEVEIDLEEDYDIDVTTTLNSENIPTYIIIANLKPSVSLANQPTLDGQQNNSQPQTPDPIPSQSYASAAKFFFKKTLKVILKQYLPVLIKTKKLLASSDTYVGDLLISHMIKNFEMFDPALRSKRNTDPIKQKYFVDNKFVMDGIVNMDVDKFKNYLEIQNQSLKLKPGKKSTKIQQSSTIMLVDLIAMMTNYLNQMIDVYLSFLLGLFKIKNIPTTLPGFLTYQSFRNILLPTNIIKMLGGQGVNLLTIPAWIEPPNKNNEMERTFKQIVTLLINGSIEITNITFNQQIGQKMPAV